MTKLLKKGIKVKRYKHDIRRTNLKGTDITSNKCVHYPSSKREIIVLKRYLETVSLKVNSMSVQYIEYI